MVEPKLYALEDPPDAKISAPPAVVDWFYQKRPYERSVPVIKVRLNITPDDLWFSAYRDLLTEHKVSHGIFMEQTSDTMLLYPASKADVESGLTWLAGFLQRINVEYRARRRMAQEYDLECEKWWQAHALRKQAGDDI